MTCEHAHACAGWRVSLALVVFVCFSNVAMHRSGQDRDVDLYHWSSAKFESTWRDTLSVLVARGRAQVGVHSAKTDWSRRILDFQYMDYDDQAAHHA